MEKYFTLNELATMTGLTERTLRTYLKTNILCGEKIEGAWRFTEEDIDAFIRDQMVKPSIKANEIKGPFRFTFEAENNICRVILRGEEKTVLDILEEYYS